MTEGFGGWGEPSEEPNSRCGESRPTNSADRPEAREPVTLGTVIDYAAMCRELTDAADAVVRLHDEVVECTRPGGVDADEYDEAFERLRAAIASGMEARRVETEGLDAALAETPPPAAEG